MVCRELTINAEGTLADLEAAMAQLQQLEENHAHRKVWLREELAKLDA